MEKSVLETNVHREDLKDEAILAASVDEPHLFGLLVDRYQESFLRTAERVVRDPREAEDIIQEAFFKMYRNAHRFVKQEGIEFKSWAYKIVLNTSFTHYQRLKKQYLNTDEEGEEALALVVSERSDMKHDVEMKILIESALADLPQELSMVLTKHYLEDKAYETIAAEERTTVAAIKMRLWRARRALKKLLDGGAGSTGEKAIVD